jgi:hypothetical protein
MTDLSRLAAYMSLFRFSKALAEPWLSLHDDTDSALPSALAKLWLNPCDHDNSTPLRPSPRRSVPRWQGLGRDFAMVLTHVLRPRPQYRKSSARHGTTFSGAGHTLGLDLDLEKGSLSRAVHDAQDDEGPDSVRTHI